MISVGVIGFGVVGKRRIEYILKQKGLNLKYVSDIKFKKKFYKKTNFYFQKLFGYCKKKNLMLSLLLFQTI